MKDFTTIITESLKPISKTISVKWTPDLKNVFAAANKEAQQYIDNIKDIVFKSIQDFYNNNPRMQKISRNGKVIVKTALDKNDPIIKDLYSLFEKIGMLGVIEWFNGKTGNSCYIQGDSPYRSYRDDINKIKWSNVKYYEVKSIDNINIPGNGYNNIPSSIMNEYRDKLCEIIDKTEISVINNNASVMVIVKPIFNKSKVKKLYNEIIENEELMRYMERLQATSKGISDYYSSKRPGEYTGD